MKKKIHTLAVIALVSPLGACAPSTPPDASVKVAEAPAQGEAPLKPLTSLNDPRVSQSIAILASRQRSFGFAIFRATTRDTKSATIGGPVRIPSGPFGYTGVDRYCVQADFESDTKLFAGNHGVVFYVEPKGSEGFLVKTTETSPLIAVLIKNEPCGSVPMEPFPELVALRKRFLADG
jgi:hypothetical protein